MKIGILVCLTFVAIQLPAVAAPVDGQPLSCNPMEIYDRLLPTTLDIEDAKGADEVIVIQFIPGDTSLEREYRIKIRIMTNGKILATRIDPVGSSIGEQFRKAQDRAPNATCETWLHDIKLGTRQFEDQSKLRSILKSLNVISVPARLPSAFYIDAARYDIEIWEKMNRIHVTVYDARDSGAPRLISWAKHTAAILGGPGAAR